MLFRSRPAEFNLVLCYNLPRPLPPAVIAHAPFFWYMLHPAPFYTACTTPHASTCAPCEEIGVRTTPAQIARQGVSPGPPAGHKPADPVTRHRYASCDQLVPLQPHTHPPPRPLGSAAHSNTVNGLHKDFCKMRKLCAHSDHDYEYTLVIMDDLSGYVMLYPCTNADAASTVDCLLDWFTRFGVCNRLYTDGGSHLVNQWVKLLAQTLRVNHHITTAYSPTANGTVENVNRQLLRALRSLLSEFKLETRQWPRLIPIVNATLNATPSARLGGFTHFRAFLGRDPVSSLHAVFNSASGAIIDSSSTDAVSSALVQLRDALDSIHYRDDRSPRPSPAALKGSLPNFDIGDFVWVADVHRHDKLKHPWRGPYTVTGTVNDRVFTVTNIADKKDVRNVDSRQLKFYAYGTDLTLTEDILEQARHDNHGSIIDAIVSHERYKNSTDFRIFLRWEGSDKIAEEPLSHLGPQVPDLIRSYIKDLPSAKDRTDLTNALDKYIRISKQPVKPPTKPKPKPASATKLRRVPPASPAPKPAAAARAPAPGTSRLSRRQRGLTP